MSSLRPAFVSHAIALALVLPGLAACGQCSDGLSLSLDASRLEGALVLQSQCNDICGPSSGNPCTIHVENPGPAVKTNVRCASGKEVFAQDGSSRADQPDATYSLRLDPTACSAFCGEPAKSCEESLTIANGMADFICTLTTTHLCSTLGSGP